MTPVTGRRPSAAEIDATVAHAQTWLSPELEQTLASLAGAPRSVCEATVALLPLGSRLALETMGLAVQGAADRHGRRSLSLTALAYEVIPELAEAASAREQSTLAEWEDRSGKALDSIRASYAGAAR